jgi:hypothetical protein
VSTLIWPQRNPGLKPKDRDTSRGSYALGFVEVSSSGSFSKLHQEPNVALFFFLDWIVNETHLFWEKLLAELRVRSPRDHAVGQDACRE